MRSTLGLVHTLLLVYQQGYCQSKLSKSLLENFNMKHNNSPRFDFNPEDTINIGKEFGLADDVVPVFRLKEHYHTGAELEQARSLAGLRVTVISPGKVQDEDQEDADQGLQSRGRKKKTNFNIGIPIPVVISRKREKVVVYDAYGRKKNLPPGSYHPAYPHVPYPQYPPHPSYAYYNYPGSDSQLPDGREWMGSHHQKSYVTTAAALDAFEELRKYPPLTPDGHVNGKNVRKLASQGLKTLRKIAFWRYVHPIQDPQRPYSRSSSGSETENTDEAEDGKRLRRKESSVSPKQEKKSSRRRRETPTKK
nr:PREDICTED: uncharacterized protein LOC109035510 [Bemisia tabaci]